MVCFMFHQPEARVVETSKSKNMIRHGVFVHSHVDFEREEYLDYPGRLIKIKKNCSCSVTESNG
jgi:uncharacterized protein YfkK (UPF0435 family)